MRHRKKTLERHYFDVFRDAVADFPAGNVEHNDAPDFLITGAEPTVGVEVTQLFRQPHPGKCPDEQFEAEEQIIVDGAEALATERDVPSLLVTAYFSHHRRPQKRTRDSIIEQLVNAVADNIPIEEGVAVRLNSLQGLPAEIDALFVSRYPSLTTPLWQVGRRAGIVMQECVVDLQNKIDDKEKKLAQYLEHCASCWLLIVADWLAATSAFYEPNAATAAHEFTSTFDRVYFLELFSGRVLPLRQLPPTTA